jgi:hypothetical protein
MIITKQKNNRQLCTTELYKFYRVEIEPKSNFMHFRNQLIGKSNIFGKVLGQREDGMWDTHAWLISKDAAHRENNNLVIDDQGIRTTLNPIVQSITHIIGDTCKAHIKK